MMKKPFVSMTTAIQAIMSHSHPNPTTNCKGHFHGLPHPSLYRYSPGILLFPLMLLFHYQLSLLWSVPMFHCPKSKRTFRLMEDPLFPYFLEELSLPLYWLIPCRNHICKPLPLNFRYRLLHQMIEKLAVPPPASRHRFPLSLKA